MKSVTVRDLRYDFPKVEKLLRTIGAVEVTKRGKVVAEIRPKQTERPPLPDFEARMRENYGDKVFDVSGADLISQDREDRF